MQKRIHANSIHNNEVERVLAGSDEANKRYCKHFVLERENTHVRVSTSEIVKDSLGPIHPHDGAERGDKLGCLVCLLRINAMIYFTTVLIASGAR